MPLSLFAPLDALLARSPAPERVAFLAKRAYAHRGLHGGARIENSRAAFVAAIEQGFGIELDVQAANGGEAFVFHDARLDRLTTSSGDLVAQPAAALDRIVLTGTDETIPRIGEVMALVAGRVPVLIEVKAPGIQIGQLCLAVRRALEGYRGPVAVMSFNPNVTRWFHEHAPRVVRGLVISEQDDGSGWWRSIRGRLIRHLSVWRAKPDFLAYDIRDLPSRFAAQQRARGLVLLTWTVRTADQEQTALEYADEIIFEHR